MNARTFALAALTTLSASVALSPSEAEAVDCNSALGLFALVAAPVVVTSSDVDTTRNTNLVLDVQTQMFRVAQNPLPAACVNRVSMQLFYARSAAELETNRTRALNGQATPNTATFGTLNAAFIGNGATTNLRNYRATVPRNFAAQGQMVYYRWVKIIDNRDAVAQDLPRIPVFGAQQTFVATAPPAPPPPPPPPPVLPNLVAEFVGTPVAYRPSGASLGNQTETYIPVNDSFCALQGAARLSEEAVNKPLLGAGIRAIVQPPAIAWRIRNASTTAVPAATVVTNDVINQEGSTPNVSHQINGLGANAAVNMPAFPRAAVEVWQFPAAGGSGCFSLVESDGGNPFPECVEFNVDVTNAVVESVDGAVNNRLRFGCR
jgi:hypothetical protein